MANRQNAEVQLVADFVGNVSASTDVSFGSPNLDWTTNGGQPGLDWIALSFGAGAGILNSVPPVISNQDPIPGSLITATQVVQLDVTDDGGVLPVLMLCVRFNNLDFTEVIHNSDFFEANYLATSTRTAITNGYHFAVKRFGGWPDSDVTFFVKATDASGNVGT